MSEMTNESEWLIPTKQSDKKTQLKAAEDKKEQTENTVGNSGWFQHFISLDLAPDVNPCFGGWKGGIMKT